MYAGRKRRKPVVRGVKPASAEVVKSNPSKRHRDRLNSELDRLARLLPFPEDVTSSLDKLSILRLSVSYLRNKNFFSVALKNHTCNGLTPNSGNHDNSKTAEQVDGWMPEGELLLQALNGFVLVITAEGIIFYCSHTIQDYLGFHQTDVMHQSVLELIHTEDQQEFRRNLHWALNPPCTAPSPPADCQPVPSSSLVTYDPDQLPPENSSFLERSFTCRFRCLLDNSTGFLGLNLQGRLKFLLGQNQRLEDGGNVPPQLALFTIATPLQPPSILEIRTKNMIFRTKHKLDFTPMACDARGKIVLGYTEAELRVRGSGYQFIHAADMLYCAENHMRMIKTGESGLTVFRLLTKDNRWKWVQANARLVYKNGKPDYIIATQRPLVEEEGGEHLRKRSMHLPFTFATGEALLYQTNYPIPGLAGPPQGKGKSSKSKKTKADKAFRDSLDPSSLLGALMRQDESVYVCQPAVQPRMSFHSSLLSEQPGEGSSGSFDRGAPLGGSSWTAEGGLSRPEAEPSSFDPLLATLDSLSLEGGEEACSNGELLGALEDLGLSAEDLELLLLDERMIRVEMDPDFIPSLNDLLTNNEILSYVRDSLEGWTEEERGVGGGTGTASSAASRPPLHPPALAPASSLLSQAGPSATVSQLPGHAQPPKQPPVAQLSQQMQQRRLYATQPAPAGAPGFWPAVPPHAVPTLTQADALNTKILTRVHNDSHWASPMELDGHCHQQEQRTLFFNGQASQPVPQGQHQRQPHLWQQQDQIPVPLQSQQDQLPVPLQSQQDQLPVPLQSQCHFRQGAIVDRSSLNGGPGDHYWRGCSYWEQPAASNNDAFLPNSHTAFFQTARTAHMDYSGGTATGEECHYQAPGSSYPPAHQRQLQQQFQSQAPSAGFAQYPTQMSSLELEQILGLSPPHRPLPALDPYGLVSHPASGGQDATGSKVENGTSVLYAGGCLMPNGNSAAPSDNPPLPSLPDPQTTSFYH